VMGILRLLRVRLTCSDCATSMPDGQYLQADAIDLDAVVDSVDSMHVV
jgi:hypothetical protein